MSRRISAGKCADSELGLHETNYSFMKGCAFSVLVDSVQWNTVILSFRTAFFLGGRGWLGQLVGRQAANLGYP